MFRPVFLSACLALLLTPLTAKADDDVCHYDGRLVGEDEGPFHLAFTIDCPGDVQSFTPLDRRVARYISEPEITGTGARTTATYDLSLFEASAYTTVDLIQPISGSWVATGLALMPEPRAANGNPKAIRYRITGTAFNPGQAPDDDGWALIPAGQLNRAGFTAFGPFETEYRTLPARGGGEARVRISYAADLPQFTAEELSQWVDRGLQATIKAWDGFPTTDLAIHVLKRSGRGVPFGQVRSGGGISMVIYIGTFADQNALYRDWVLFHELIHVAVPFSFNGFWFTEGMATYQEPLIRAREGIQTWDDLWTEFALYMPRGAQAIESTGLDRTGRAGWYWGGAVYMLLADLGLRRETNGRFGLEDCFHALHDRIGDYRVDAEPEVFIAVCDEASGTSVLTDLARAHVQGSEPVDVERVLARLGVRLEGRRAVVSDAAPEADLRKAIQGGAVR